MIDAAEPTTAAESAAVAPERRRLGIAAAAT